MKRRGIPEAIAGHVNVTPLIDIVLVLIVFFMLVAHIGVITGAEPMNLPASIRGIRLRDMNNTLTLNIHTAPTGPFVTALVKGEHQRLNVGPKAQSPTLLETLRYFRYQSPRGTPPFKVVLRADKNMPYEDLQPVLKACEDAKVTNVNFTTVQE